MMRKLAIILFLILAAVVCAFQFRPVKQTVTAVITTPSYLNNKSGASVKDRVKLPEGFKRVTYDSLSFQYYIRHQSLKYGAKVINYDGTPYFYQLGHVGVLDVSVPDNGLQQCADALIT